MGCIGIGRLRFAALRTASAAARGMPDITVRYSSFHHIACTEIRLGRDSMCDANG
jgi:hypothetical protein